MAQVKVTFLSTTGLQQNMADDDTLRLAAAPSNIEDGTNKKYVDDQDAAVAQDAQDANDALNSAIQDQISDLEQADADLAQAIEDEIAARTQGDLDILEYIDKGGSDGNNKYVERDGDDMLGPLTFATDKITLGVDGTGTYTGDVNIGSVEIKPAGQLHITNPVGTGLDKAFTIIDAIGESVSITNGGEAYFDQSVGCGAEVYGVYSSFNFKAGRTGMVMKIFSGQDSDATNSPAIAFNADGSGDFVGEVRAEKIDGGEYAV